MTGKMQKGQAAMEFLMTYGWAILAAIIVIGVLAIAGVFTPGKYAPQACAVTAPFYCNAWNAKTAGVNIELKNQGGEAYHVKSVDISNCGTANNTGTGWDIAADALQNMTVSCALTTGNLFKGDVTVTYTKSGSAVELSSTGSVTQKVTA
ncbi:hypothetical protein HYT92_01740 [Candidatus Pacearchaeota archaeon]|nr:hypothetical protein [Candidatus Pacearchaeota archaeon]